MNKDGFLSVSEVISFPDHPFLLNWARKLALQGLDHNRVSTLGKYAGRIMHWEMLQKYGNSLEPMGKDVQEAYADPEAVEHGGIAWGKLQAWANEKFRVCYDYDPRIFRVEFPIEDEELKVRARLDLVFNSGYLYDWKSSRHLYAESILELGAYDYLWNRKYPDTPLVGWTIVRCCHEDDSPAEQYEFEESEIKKAGLVFASMIPAVRAFREFDAESKGILAKSMGGGV
jgi:hypothetical protein